MDKPTLSPIDLTEDVEKPVLSALPKRDTSRDKIQPHTATMIRFIYNTEEFSARKIAKVYGVTPWTVSKILRGWSHR